MNTELAIAIARAFRGGLAFQKGVRYSSLGMDWAPLQEGDHWVTVHPNGEREKGLPVLISGGGTIKSGMGGKFDGENISHLPEEKESKKEENPAETPVKSEPNPARVENTQTKEPLSKEERLRNDLQSLEADKRALGFKEGFSGANAHTKTEAGAREAIFAKDIATVRPSWADKKITGRISKNGDFTIYVDTCSTYGEESHDVSAPTSRLSHDEALGIGTYTDTPAYRMINHYVRSYRLEDAPEAYRDPNDKDFNRNERKWLGWMDSAFKKAKTTDSMVLVRGMRASQFLRYMYGDGTFNDPAFLSYSAFADRAFTRAPVWLVTRVRQGAKALSVKKLSRFGDEESEILLNRDTRQTIRGIEKITVGGVPKLIVYTDIDRD